MEIVKQSDMLKSLLSACETLRMNQKSYELERDVIKKIRFRNQKIESEERFDNMIFNLRKTVK